MSLTDSDRKEKLAELINLSLIPGIGPSRFYQLVSAFSSISEVLMASETTLATLPGFGAEISRRIRDGQNRQNAQKIVDEIEKLGWRYYLYDDSDYPSPLKEIPDRPPYLFYLGEYRETDNLAIAIVGSRSTSEEGRLFAENLAGTLAENGVTVISGMARGTDTSAHRGALNAGGRTIAVFGCSLETIYPPEGRELAKKIIEKGAIFSEYLPGTVPFGPNFPKRNRIISGLSQGVVIIEAAERSGALSTAGHALSQNREVFAVPGSPRLETSKGTNRLIKEGAKLLTSVEDIFSELPRLKGEVKAQQARLVAELTATEEKVIQLFASGPVHLDALSRQMNTPVTELMPILLALELKGLIRELAGKRYILN